MKTIKSILLAAMALTAAYGPIIRAAQAADAPASTSAAPVMPGSVAAPAGSAQTASEIELFTTSSNCAPCHSGMTDESGKDVSNEPQWRSTMMANAVRDPYYLASVSAEIAKNPALKGVIEDKCAACHAPMARFTDTAAGRKAVLFGESGYLTPGHRYHGLAFDGVSCTVCHQIMPGNLGHVDSFSGGMLLDTKTPRGQRSLYGPFPSDPALSSVMSTVSGFVPVQGKHMSQSELCAVCHTLYTPYIKADGTLSTQLFPEQTLYLEWKHSTVRESATCQSCHMPAAQGSVKLSPMSTQPVQPFAQHIFVGGNAYMLGLLKKYQTELAVSAAPPELDATLRHTFDQLAQRTATVAVNHTKILSGKLTFEVSVRPQTGHKFPTGFPSRRAWLHVTVTDRTGKVVFESGSFTQDGAILGNDNDADPLQFESHHRVISAGGQVQIYEAIIQNDRGEVTTTLLEAAKYAKDNRLLPAGFNKATAAPDIAVFGEATQDADFDGGGDIVTYEIGLGETAGPYHVAVELLYQSIGYRWAQNVGRTDTAEARRFARYYTETPNTPVVIASQKLAVAE